MSRSFVEGELLFEFDELWEPITSWDKHPAYQNGIREMDKGRAVDFIGVYDDKFIYLIEVKDYRLHKRKKVESPLTEFELKVRNTVAGLVGSGRREHYSSECLPYIEALLKPQKFKLILIFWIEQPRFSGMPDATRRKRLAAGAGIAMRQAKTRVKWLDARAFNVSQDDYKPWVPGLTIKNLARKPPGLS
jgi:hypothetical protein